MDNIESYIRLNDYFQLDPVKSNLIKYIFGQKYVCGMITIGDFIFHEARIKSIENLRIHHLRPLISGDFKKRFDQFVSGLFAICCDEYCREISNYTGEFDKLDPPIDWIEVADTGRLKCITEFYSNCDYKRCLRDIKKYYPYLGAGVIRSFFKYVVHCILKIYKMDIDVSVINDSSNYVYEIVGNIDEWLLPIIGICEDQDSDRITYNYRRIGTSKK